ncbi:MAG TPA: hypothetical protein VMW34_12150 [Anaerolineales bacterium]|nr:hypothetical protein [Anaerolineales bacterium]
MVIRQDYEVSSEGAVRHWEIPYARLEDPLPVVTMPAQVNGLLAGSQLTGTILSIDAVTSVAVIDFTCSMVYWQEVRNVLTYVGNVEATWGVINIGDPIYYDGSATMPATIFLSTSPLDDAGPANTLFGWAVPRSDADMALFPKGIAIAPGSTVEIAVMQRGAGGA